MCSQSLGSASEGFLGRSQVTGGSQQGDRQVAKQTDHRSQAMVVQYVPVFAEAR